MCYEYLVLLWALWFVCSINPIIVPQRRGWWWRWWWWFHLKHFVGLAWRFLILFTTSSAGWQVRLPCPLVLHCSVGHTSFCGSVEKFPILFVNVGHFKVSRTILRVSPLLLLILSVAGRLDKIDLLWVRQRRSLIIVAYCGFLYFTGSNLPVLSTLLLCPRGYLVREHLKLIIQVLRKLLYEILSAASAINHGIKAFAFISYPCRAQKVIYHKFLSLEGKWVEMLSA